MSGEMEVRAFNSNGIDAFREFLASLRRDAPVRCAADLLADTSLTHTPYTGIYISPRAFANRRQAADYFHEILSVVPPEQIRRDAGLWSWLSLFYFDQACPPMHAGARKVRNDYTYIFMPDESRYFYRHLLFVSWYVKWVAPTHNRLFLDTSFNQLDKFTQDVMKRLYLTRIGCIFEVLDRLYWDSSTNRPRKGVNSPGRIVAGDLAHRLPVRIRQLEKTYDLLSLEADQLLDLLGDEFKSLLATSPELARSV